MPRLLLSLIQVATTRTMSTHRDSPGMTVASINVSVKTHPPEVTNVLLGRISVSGAVFWFSAHNIVKK